MRAITLLTLAIMAFYLSCRSESSGNTKADKSDAQVLEAPAEIKNRCFAYDHEDNLIGLNIGVVGNRFSGKLAYAFSDGRERSSGTIEGYMNGDTLVGEYVYWVGGGRAIREVVFLNRVDALIEGTGEVEQRDGKTMYKQRSALKFDESVRLQAIPCQKGGTLN